MAKERAGNAGFGTLFLRAERVPAGGYKQILVRDDPATDKDSTPTDLEVSSGILANSHIRVELDEGGIRGISVRDEKLLGAIGLHLRQDHTDTWTFDTDRFEEPVVATLSDAEWVVEEEGPLRGRVRIEAQLDGSSIRWTLDLHRSNPRLQIKLEVSFNEKFEMMQMPIELVRASEKWLSGSGTGWAERTAAATEWPVQGWSLVESEGNHLALIIHDAYSVSMNGSLWQWTLLRSPRMAWGGEDPEVYAGRDWHTDQGQHTFDFTLCADQNLEAGRLNKLTRQQAQPPAVFDRYEGLDRPPWGTARRAPCGSPQSNARWPTERCLTSRNRDPASRGLRREIVCEQRRSPLNIAPLQEDTRK